MVWTNTSTILLDFLLSIRPIPSQEYCHCRFWATPAWPSNWWCTKLVHLVAQVRCVLTRCLQICFKLIQKKRPLLNWLALLQIWEVQSFCKIRGENLGRTTSALSRTRAHFRALGRTLKKCSFWKLCFQEFVAHWLGWRVYVHLQLVFDCFLHPTWYRCLSILAFCFLGYVFPSKFQ